MFRVTDQASAEWDAAERFTYDIYMPLGFTEANDRNWVSEHEWLRDRSEFVVATDDSTGEVVATIRTTVDTLPNLTPGAIGNAGEYPDGVFVELGAVCARADLRGIGVMDELHRKVVCDGALAGHRGFCGDVELGYLNHLSNAYGIPARTLGEPVEFMGGMVYPFYVDYDEMFAAIRENRPGVYAWAIEAMGVDPTL